MLQGVTLHLADAVLPRHCSVCGVVLGPDARPTFCDTCWSAIRLITPPYCPCCGRPFRSPVALAYSPEHRCGACRRKPPAFDHARAIGRYEGPLRAAIHLLKYRGKLHVKGPLLQLALEHFHEHFQGAAFDAVIPIPLHRRRLMQREFNQAAVLASGLAAQLSIVVLERVLVRVRWTQPQVELSGDERRRNVKDAFAMTDASQIEGKRVLVVDDVLTTGATVSEAAKTLKAAGATRVDVFALARVV
ncbi:MAG: ComF family protein [Nitrospinae bacterium]|nr:ComF family protein [Nitrospinota bacterium]